MKEQILALFRRQKQWTIMELEQKLKCRSSDDFKKLVRTLNEMEEERLLYNNHSGYRLIDPAVHKIGTLKDISRRDYLFSCEEGTWIVPKQNAGKAFDKDEVLISVSRKENKVIHVYKRGITHITGTFYGHRGTLRFVADQNLHREVRVSNDGDFPVRHGTKAVLRIEKYRDPLVCRIETILGSINDPGMDITTVLASHRIRTTFNDDVIRQADTIPAEVQESDLKGRKDYRNLLTVTIDGDDAKDFDDAISIEKRQDGYRLYVHIADVSAYVKEGSPIDREAFLRSTSVYVADRVVPMLPFALSNGICSLNPDTDRLTLTCAMDIDSQGKCTKYRIDPSVIHSDRRCTYHKVNAFLEGDEKALREYGELALLLGDFEACARLLQAQSHKRGTIDFNTKEAKLILDQKGICVDVICKERGFAEQMIEEAMILANVCVAHTLHAKKIPGIYRIHEDPDPEKIADLSLLALSLSLKVPFYPEHVKAGDIQLFLESLADTEYFDVLSNFSLRCMKKARYDSQCLSHFGLALPEYCHFTSPIRRYADLTVHRMLRRYLFEKKDGKRDEDEKKCQKQAEHISLKEKDAVFAERTVADMKKAEYMSDKIGRSYTGHIVSIHDFGFFVCLDNTVDGLVPVAYLYDDIYLADREGTCLKGRYSGKKYTIGQAVRVTCAAADIHKGQVTFMVSE